MSPLTNKLHVLIVCKINCHEIFVLILFHIFIKIFTAFLSIPAILHMDKVWSYTLITYKLRCIGRGHMSSISSILQKKNKLTCIQVIHHLPKLNFWDKKCNLCMHKYGNVNLNERG